MMELKKSVSSDRLVWYLIVLFTVIFLIKGCAPFLPPSERYNLLILTPDEFKLPLMLFSAHKDSTDMPTLIKTVEEIESHPAYEHGRDIQEKIKMAIADLHAKWGIKYVMLVGDVDKFPVRYTRAWDSIHAGHYYAPSDLYYADLYDLLDQDQWDDPDSWTFDDWDDNRNGYIGEMGRPDGEASQWSELNVDKVDLKPDVAVGRIPVSDADELSRFLAKIIDYEQRAFGQDWMNRILLVTGDWDNPHPTAEAISDLMESLGFSSTRHYWSVDWQTYPTIAQRFALLNQELNDGCGFVIYMGHGKRQEWSGWYPHTAINLLENNPRLPVAFAAACDTAQFHFSDKPYWTKSGGEYACQTEDDIFDKDATFRRFFTEDGSTILKSYNFPQHGITQENASLKIKEGEATRFQILPAVLDQSHFSEYWRSLRSYNYPDRFVRHQYYTGKLTPISSSLDESDSTFRIVPGLADDAIGNTFQYISFESWNFPGWYLVDEGGVLILRKRPTCDYGYDQRATFKQIPGLIDGSAQSFESYVRANNFIRHRNFQIYVESGNTELFKNDATFNLTAPNHDPYPEFRSIKLADSNQYLIYRWDESSKEYIANVAELNTDFDRAAATFRRLQGLADPTSEIEYISFEALMPEIQGGIPRLRSRPSFFLRHQNYTLKVSERRPTNMQNRPEPAAVQPDTYELDSMAEEFLVKYPSGAISYIGCYTAAQPVAFAFVKRFFEEYTEQDDSPILGDLWMGAVRRYLLDDFQQIDRELERKNWYAAAIYHTPQKMMLFGDPSLRIGGVR
jgi:hypothetical protein